MHSILNGNYLAAVACMRGDVRRHLPVLFIWMATENLAPPRQCNLSAFKVIRAEDESAASMARHLLHAQGWRDHGVPDRLDGISFCLTPPSDAEHRLAVVASNEPFLNDRIMSQDFASSQELGSSVQDVVLASPNSNALDVLRGIAARQKNRPYGDASNTQDYLREARSGRMYSDGD